MLENNRRLHSKLRNNDILKEKSVSDLKKIEEKIKKSKVQKEQFQYNKEVYVIDKGINSIYEQCALIKTCISTAKDLVIITSYTVRPLDKKNSSISETLRVILESIAERQDDSNFTLCFLYNKSHWLENLALGYKRTTVSQKSTKNKPSDWEKIIDIYNKEENEKKNGKPIKNLKCKFILIGAKAEHLAGTHHNKFLINDRGLVATLGVSIGNKTKFNSFDSGAVVLNMDLAKTQRDYFLKFMLPNGAAISILKKGSNDYAKLVLENKNYVKNIVNKVSFLTDTNYRKITDTLKKYNISTNGKISEILWLQNTGSLNALSKTEKPIGKSIEYMFENAPFGSTICIRRGNIYDTSIKKWVLDALKRGVNVNILTSKNTSILKYLNFLAANKKLYTGKLEIRFMEPPKETWIKYKFNPKNLKINDHAKVYILRLQNGKNAFVMTGTHNLDSQSFKRSNENLLVVNNNCNLAKSLFDDFWDSLKTKEKSKNNLSKEL